MKVLKESALEADDDVYFPPGSSVTAIFKPDQKCYGKQKWMRVNQAKVGGGAAEASLCARLPLSANSFASWLLDH